jgi:hypothetical protein
VPKLPDEDDEMNPAKAGNNEHFDNRNRPDVHENRDGNKPAQKFASVNNQEGNRLKNDKSDSNFVNDKVPFDKDK